MPPHAFLPLSHSSQNGLIVNKDPKIVAMSRMLARRSANVQHFGLHAVGGRSSILASSVSGLSSSGSVVLERPTDVELAPSVKKETSKTKSKGWQLRIFNDSLNTREHVARCLVQVTGKSESEAYNLMMSAHKNGVAVVGVWMFEQAEAYKDQLLQTGLVADISPIE